MPLTRLNDSAFDAQLDGVYFGMWNGSSPVRCLVTHAGQINSDGLVVVDSADLNPEQFQQGLA